ncbi:MAG: metallophosphoesterase family protein [Candidatus Nanoarchaeia archaeon]
MKFAHLADCHIGSWRDPRLLEISVKAFEMAVDKCIDEDVDFVLISGDLFNTALPGISRLKSVVIKLKELRDYGINVYVIQGSHDFSPTGKTMLDVLESAGLVYNVVRGSVVNGKLRLNFTKDSKTGAMIAGMLGKKGMLEKSYYEDLDRVSLETEEGFKVFMFHTALTELKSAELNKMESAPLSLLPKGFDYYAGGHVHEVIEEEPEGYGKIVYPGPCFPNSFREVEKLKHGGFYLYDDGKTRFEPLRIFDVYSVSLDCKNKSCEEIHSSLKDYAKDNVKDKIVTLRLYGKILSGRISDINLGEIINEFYESGAYFVMKNTAGLTTPEFEEIKIKNESVDELEDNLIKEHCAGDKFIQEEAEFTKEMINALMIEEEEGERKVDFEERVKESADKVFEKINQL